MDEQGMHVRTIVRVTRLRGWRLYVAAALVWMLSPNVKAMLTASPELDPR